MRVLVASLVLSVASGRADAQSTILAPPTILHGNCLPLSQIGSGSSKSNLDEHSTRISCDTVVITPMMGDRVLIQFARAANKRGDVISFGGLFSEPDVVEVDHLYLNDGQKLETTSGLCRIFRGPVATYKSFVCGARIERGDMAIGTAVAFNVSNPIKRGTLKARH